MSIDDNPLTYRRCVGNEKFFLQDWFAHVELLAWTRAETYYTRPKEIFLVVGQFLSPAFAKAHKKYGSIGCKIAVKANVQIPDVVSVAAIGSFDITKVEANLGFDYIMKKSDVGSQYNIFLDTYTPNSGPIQRISKALKTRVQEQYQ